MHNALVQSTTMGKTLQQQDLEAAGRTAFWPGKVEWDDCLCSATLFLFILFSSQADGMILPSLLPRINVFIAQSRQSLISMPKGLLAVPPRQGHVFVFYKLWMLWSRQSTLMHHNYQTSAERFYVSKLRFCFL